MSAPQQTLNDALARAVERWPDRTFLRVDGLTVTFGEFEREVGRLAAGLAERGLGPGDRLVVVMRNSLACLHTWFAANRLGAVWAPVNTELRGRTLAHVVALADPRLCVVDADLLEAVRPALAAPPIVHGATLDSLYLDPAAPARRDVRFHDQAALLFTSGTTGRSKAVMLSHQYFVKQASILAADFELRHDDVLYCPFPLFHADATALTTVPALLLGATAAISPRFSVSRFWAEIREHGATVFDFMGATLAMLYKADASPDDADNPVRLAWGVPVPEWVEEFERRFDLRVVELYGSVEASIPVTQPLHEPRIPGSCGRATAGFRVGVQDEDGNPVAPGEVGEIVVRPTEPSIMMDGYQGMPEATCRAFRNLWFHTGDLGRLDTAGNLYFTGRGKDAIRRRGENISAFEVEEGLLLHPDVVEAAVVGVPSDLSEEEVKAYVVRRPGSPLTPALLVAHAERTLARFQVPRYVEFVDALPKTPTGKVAKQRLGRDAPTAATWDRERVMAP